MEGGDKRETGESSGGESGTGQGEQGASLMTTLRLSHCGSAAGLILVGKHEDGLCDCGLAETVKHVMMDCRKYTRERKEMYSEVMRAGEHVVSLRVLLGYRNHQREVTKAVKFLFVTGLFLRRLDCSQ